MSCSHRTTAYQCPFPPSSTRHCTASCASADAPDTAPAATIPARPDMRMTLLLSLPRARAAAPTRVGSPARLGAGDEPPRNGKKARDASAWRNPEGFFEFSADAATSHAAARSASNASRAMTTPCACRDQRAPLEGDASGPHAVSGCVREPLVELQGSPRAAASIARIAATFVGDTSASDSSSAVTTRVPLGHARCTLTRAPRRASMASSSTPARPSARTAAKARRTSRPPPPSGSKAASAA